MSNPKDSIELTRLTQAVKKHGSGRFMYEVLAEFVAAYEADGEKVFVHMGLGKELVDGLDKAVRDDPNLFDRLVKKTEAGRQAGGGRTA